MAIKNGDTLRVHYTGTLSDGTVFDSSREREPLEFTMGKGMLIPGFEAAVMGHEAGETVTVPIPPGLWRKRSRAGLHRGPRPGARSYPADRGRAAAAFQ